MGSREQNLVGRSGQSGQAPRAQPEPQSATRHGARGPTAALQARDRRAQTRTAPGAAARARPRRPREGRGPGRHLRARPPAPRRGSWRVTKACAVPSFRVRFREPRARLTPPQIRSVYGRSGESRHKQKTSLWRRRKSRLGRLGRRDTPIFRAVSGMTPMRRAQTSG